jgi:hypothetical protein
MSNPVSSPAPDEPAAGAAPLGPWTRFWRRQPLLVAISWSLNGLAMLCAAGCGLILNLASWHWTLLILVIVLSPVAFLLAVLGCLFHGAGTSVVCTLWRRTGVYATAHEDGVRLSSRFMHGAPVIPWSSITEIVCISESPYTVYYRLRTTSGVVEHADFIDDDRFPEVAWSHSVLVRGFDNPLAPGDLDGDEDSPTGLADA